MAAAVSSRLRAARIRRFEGRRSPAGRRSRKGAGWRSGSPDSASSSTRRAPGSRGPSGSPTSLELFERFAYYGSKAILAVYVAEQVGLGPREGGLAGRQPVQHAALLPADPRRHGGRPLRLQEEPARLLRDLLRRLPPDRPGRPAGRQAAGGRARAEDLHGRGAGRHRDRRLADQALASSAPSRARRRPTTKGLGYSIYYTLVNLGGAIGPILALQVRENLGIAYVLVMSSLTSPGAGGRDPASSSRSRRSPPTRRRRARWARSSPTCCWSSATCAS